MQSIDPQTAARWLRAGEASLLDVREPQEYAAEHIEAAHLQPLSGVTYAALPAPMQGKKLVVQCHLGGRSARACELLSAERPGIEVYNLEGGIEAWKAAGLPVVK
jgi:rhodanese-related sulfurtransferase